MFPTLSSIIEYVAGIKINLPIQTFGLIVAISFWLSYLAFKAEFYRKEKLGLVKPFVKPAKPRWLNILLQIWYALLIFLLGYKSVYILQQIELFQVNPQQFIFSLRGHLVGGLLPAFLFLGWLFYQVGSNKNAYLDREQVIHPYQVTDRMLLWCATIGFVGAILFAKLENIDQLFSQPKVFLTSYNGLTFLGGFIFGTGIYLYRTNKMGIPLLTALDIGSPGMVLAYGFGRIGCHLSGDGDWGIINTAPKPGWLSWAPDWTWSFTYPHNVIHAGKYIQGCYEKYCNELVAPVFPTSFYESLIGLTFFFVIWSSRNRIKTPGLMFFIFIIFNGIERFFMEFIKTNPTYCFGNICITQAQGISIVFFLVGVSGLVWIYFVKDKNDIPT